MDGIKTNPFAHSDIDVGLHPVHLNRHYELLYLAGYSTDGQTIYIDKRMPPFFDGINVDKYILVHEIVEKSLIDKLGFNYNDAHALATKAEHIALDRDGVDKAKYDAFVHHWIHVVENNTTPDHWPPDLDTTPYKKQCRTHIVETVEQNVEKSEETLEKKWPKHYNRVKGQDAKKGVASKKQYRYMQAMAGQGDAHAKEYLANSKQDGLPGEGTGGERGKREAHRAAQREKTKKTDDTEVPEAVSNSKKIKRIKDQHASKPVKTLDEQIASIKDKYKSSLTKARDTFYANVEGALDKSIDEELISHMLDMDVLFFAKSDEAACMQLYNEAERFWDSILSPEERVVYELGYLAKEGDTDALDSLEKFIIELDEELEKQAEEFELQEEIALIAEQSLNKHLESIGKSNYGPKGSGAYNPTDNIQRKAGRTGVTHDDVGQNKAEQRFTPSVQGTFAQQATREAKADQKRSKAQPVKVFTQEEKEAFAAKRGVAASPETSKKADKKVVDLDEMIEEHKHLTHVLDTPSHEDDKKESKKQKKELAEYEKERAEKAEEQHFHIHQNGFRLTDKPVPLSQINSQHGGVKKLEAAGYILHAAKPEAMDKSADNSKVKGKVNGESYRNVHGYKRFTSGPNRGEYVHRHEAEKRVGRKLSSKEHVDHVGGNRAGTKNTKIMSASKHSAKTNKTRANKKGFSGKKRYEHTRD